MIKKFITIFLILVSINVAAQENDSKLKIQSANIGFGGFYIKTIFSEEGGTTLFADVTFSINKHLISSSYLSGTEIGILGNSTYNFDEISLLYGRELKVANWLSFDGFAGLGFYNQNSKNSYVADDKSVSFPIRINTKFYFNKKFGMGLNSNYSINSVNNNFSTNLIFHYKFN